MNPLAALGLDVLVLLGEACLLFALCWVVAKRLDQIDRRMTRLERDVGIAVETLAVFIRFWITTTPALPEPAAQAARAAPPAAIDDAPAVHSPPMKPASTSPVPVSTSVTSLSATIIMASSRRSTRSVRQSLVSSMAERTRWP